MKEIVWAVIPARYGSTRFPGKPLVQIAGKPLLQWVIEGTKKAKQLDSILVATDDERIANLAKTCGVRVAMTDSALPSGSDRIWAAIKNEKVDILMNVQGDEPLVDGELIDSLVQPMLKDATLEMATLAHPISVEELKSEHAVKVVVNQNFDALYFSRFPIPYSRAEMRGELKGVYKHIGMYAYRKTFLERYCKAPQAEIEKAESLEQLRALYMGGRIRVILTQKRSLGVDTPEDVTKIEQILQSKRSL